MYDPQINFLQSPCKKKAFDYSVNKLLKRSNKIAQNECFSKL